MSDEVVKGCKVRARSAQSQGVQQMSHWLSITIGDLARFKGTYNDQSTVLVFLNIFGFANYVLYCIMCLTSLANL